MNGEKEQLETIANAYITPDPGRIIDQKTVRLIVKEIMPMIKGPKVLEMGFGDNCWTDSIIRNFGHSYIVDASKKLIDKARKIYNDKITIYQSFFEEFTPIERFDTILSTFVLEHVEDPVQVLGMTKNWLNDDGTLIVIVPNADSLHRRLAVCMGMQKNTWDIGETDKKMGHRRVYTIDKMAKDISKAGLKIIDKKGIHVKLFPQAMMKDCTDEMLNGLVKLGMKLPMEYSASIVFTCKIGEA